MARLCTIILIWALLISGCNNGTVTPPQTVTTVQAPPTATPTPPSAGVSFKGGFETAVFQYKNTVNNWHDAQPGASYSYWETRLSRVNSPVRAGNWALRVEVRPGDNYDSSGERAEVYWMYGPDGKHIVENEASGTPFYAISVYLPLDFVAPYNSLHPNQGTAWGIFQQLHGNDVYHAPPPFAIGATDTYYVQMYSGDLDALNDPIKSHTVKYPLGALQRGKWVDFVWKISFAKTFTGSVDVWRRIEGETSFTQVLSAANIPTLQFKSSINGGAVLDAYWKTGYYTSEETFTRVIYIDSNTRGDNFNDVVSAAFPMSSVTPAAATTFSATPTSTATATINAPPNTPRDTPTQTVTTVPPTATATPTASTVVLSAGTYDESNPGFAYSGSWLNYSGVGPYNNTLHYTQTVGDTASFSFSGASFKIFYTTSSDRGNIEVWVDGSLVTTINANSNSVAWQHKYISPSFAAGTHTVQLKHAGPTGAYIDLDAITIFP